MSCGGKLPHLRLLRSLARGIMRPAPRRRGRRAKIGLPVPRSEPLEDRCLLTVLTRFTLNTADALALEQDASALEARKGVRNRFQKRFLTPFPIPMGQSSTQRGTFPPLGHVLGLGHDSSDDVMGSLLPLGVRRLPGPADLIDAAFSSDWDDHLLEAGE